MARLIMVLAFAVWLMLGLFWCEMVAECIWCPVCGALRIRRMHGRWVYQDICIYEQYAKEMYNDN